MTKPMMTKPIWIFAKGPTLDTFDFNIADGYRVGINEAGLYVPGADIIAQDRVFLIQIPSTTDKKVYFPTKRLCSGEVIPTINETVKFKNQHTWILGIDTTLGNNTGSSAIELFHKLGFDFFNLVAFDNITKGIDIENLYAKCLKIKRVGSKFDKSIYEGCNKLILETITRLNVKVKWW